MNHLSINLLFFILLQIVPNFYCQRISIQRETVNGVTTFYYNGRPYASRQEVYAQIAKDYPGAVYRTNEPGNGNSNGPSNGNSNRPSNGNSNGPSNGNSNGPSTGNSNGPSNGNLNERTPVCNPIAPTGDRKKPTGDREKPTGDGEKPTGDVEKPTGNRKVSTENRQVSTGNSGNYANSIVNKFKGNNPFSNAIFDRIWKGYNYKQDSQRGYIDMKRRFLEETNEYRKAHGASPLTIDTTLELKAKNYAYHIASIGQLVHDPRNTPERMGENLAKGSIIISHLAVKLWYDEIALYNYDRPGFALPTAHFTALVWKSTTKAGFGIVERNGELYVVCKYTPPGNVRNKYRTNVSRRIY